MQVQNILAQLKEKGFRITKTRIAVLQMLCSAQAPLSALQILQQLKQQHIQVNKTTVYRELTFLKEQHIIREIEFGDNHSYVELALGEHHHHVRCIQCKRVEDIDVEDQLHLAQQQIAKKSQFQVMNHSLEFFGLCVECQ